MTKWMTLIVTVVVGILMGSSLSAKMCADEREKIHNWPDKQHDFPYCNYELSQICVRTPAAELKSYDKPIPNWNKDFPLSDFIGDHCSDDYTDYAYAYLVGQLGYCGTNCPESVLSAFPPKDLVTKTTLKSTSPAPDSLADDVISNDLSKFPDIWVPYSRIGHVPTVGSNLAGFFKDVTDDGNMEGATAEEKEQVLRDMYRSANYFTLGEKPNYVNQACTVSTESELRDALTWVTGFNRSYTFKQFDEDYNYELFYAGNNYTTEALGGAIATWAFDHMCTTGARKITSLPVKQVDAADISKGYTIVYPDADDPKDTTACDGSACGEVFADQQMRVTRYLLIPYICKDNGKVENTAKPPSPAFPVMWKRVHALQYLEGYDSVKKFGNCLMAGNDASNIKPVKVDDVVTYDSKGNPTYKIEYVWIQDTTGCWGEECVIEKTIQLKNDITVAQPITIKDRAPYLTSIYELTVTGKNKGTDYQITTGSGFKPVNNTDQNGLFNMVEQADRLIVSDVSFKSDLAALVSGPGTASVQDSTIHSKVPITVRDGSKIVNNVFIPNGTVPFLNVADGATYFTIQQNTFGSGEASLPSVAIKFGKLGASCAETNTDNTCKKYDTPDMSGSTFDNVIDGYVLNDKLPYVENAAVAVPSAASSAVAVYHSGASGECNAKFNSINIGCYSIPITLKPNIYAVEVFAIKAVDKNSKQVVPLGLFRTYKVNQCAGKLDVDPKVGGAATIWMREDYKDKSKPVLDKAGKPIFYKDGTPVLKTTALWELGIQPDGKVDPLTIRMIAYGIALNANPAGAPSALSALMTVDLNAADLTAGDVDKAKGKYMNWLTGPVSKWANACVDNKTCDNKDVECKMNCGWVNACAELQQEIDRLAYCKFACTKQADAEMTTSYGMKIGYKVCAEMDFASKGGDKAKCAAAGGIYKNEKTGYDEVVFNQLMDGWSDKKVLDPKGTSKQPGLITEVCQVHATADLKPKYLWKNFDGTLDYEPEDPAAVACYWDPVSKQQTGQSWTGDKCVPTNKSKCIWDDTAKKMTGKIWEGSSSSEGKCHDNKEASECAQTKGMAWLEGKCQSEKDACVAQGKEFSDQGKCQCPKGTTIAKDGSCFTPPPSTGCKNSTDTVVNGICVPASTGGGTPGGGSPGAGGGTTPGQNATTPPKDKDKKPLTGVGGEAVQQTPETPSGAEDSGSKLKKFFGCTLVR